MTNPLCREKSASTVYGPQNGADPETVARLARGLANFAEKITALLAGILEPGAEALYACGVYWMYALARAGVSREEAMKRAEPLPVRRTVELLRALKREELL